MINENKSQFKNAINEIDKKRISLHKWATGKFDKEPDQLQYLTLIKINDKFKLILSYNGSRPRKKVNFVFRKLLLKDIESILKKNGYSGIVIINDNSHLDTRSYKTDLDNYKNNNYIGYDFENKKYYVNSVNEDLNLKSILKLLDI